MARSINESGSSWVFPDGPLEEIASRCDVITAASLVGSCKFYHDSATQSVALPASQPFGMPCVLHTHQTEVPPAHNPFYRVHKFKQEGAQKDKQHDAKDRKGTLCQLTPLDRISSDAVIPDGGTGMWAGANGDWIALLGFPWNWELVNVYTGRRIPLPPISEFKSTPDKLVFESNDQHLQLLKIAICRVPTAASNYTSFSVLAIFNAAIAVLHCASSRWTVLDNQFLAYGYSDAIIHKGIVFAVTQTGEVYAWNQLSWGPLLISTAPIPPELDEQGRYNLGSWWLARSPDGSRLFLVHTWGVTDGRDYTGLVRILPAAATSEGRHGRTIRGYGKGLLGCEVYSMDTSQLMPPRPWRRIISLGSYSLFLGVNYPIIIPVEDGAEHDRPNMARSNSVYTSHHAVGLAYPPSPEICRFSLNSEDCTVGFQTNIRWTWRQVPLWLIPSFANARQWNLPSRHRLCRGGGDGHLEALTGDNIDLIAAHLDVTYTVRLAACSRELYDMISKDEGKMHHWDEPCLLMPPPAYWFDEHWDVARASRLHDTVYDLVPLDHPRRSVALPFMHDRKWLGANGDWIAAADHHEWCLVNVYTERHIPLPSLPDSKIRHSIVSSRPAYSFNWRPEIYLLKIVICQVPTKGGRYADYKLIALFDKTIFYLEGGGDWRMLEALTPAPDYPNYCDAIELRGHVFAVDETDGSTYFWDTANENLMLPFVIPPPVVDDQQYAWFLAPSADGKRLMIILTVNKIGIANAEVPPDIPYAANGLQLRQYPPVATYVFELDPLSTARAGDFLWRQVNSLSDHSLFLGLNYPIIANLKKRESKAPDGTLVPFMRKNCVYTAYRNIRYNQYPKILRCNLQPDEAAGGTFMSITLGAATKLLDDMMINYSEWHTERAPQGKKVNSVEETSSLSDKIDVIMSMLVNGRSNVDPNNVPLASLVAQEENVDVNFIKNNNFNNNAYRNNSGNNYRPYPSANGNGYGNSYGNSYNNNRNVPSGLEAMLKEFISTQTAFNKSVEEKLDKIDTIASRVDRLASDVNLLKLKVMPNNDIDNKITTTANAIQVRINENIRLMAELRARWDREENEKLAKENNVAKVWTITTTSNANSSHVAAPPTINGKIIGVGNVSTPSAKQTKLPEIAKTAETACDKTAEIFSNLGNNDPIAVAHNDLDFDDCHISEVIKFLQKLAKSPNASAINLAFTKHITNALIKAREEKLKLETSIPRKLEDGWEPIIKMKFNDFECNALCDLGASISVMPKKIYDMLDLPPLKNCYLDVNLADNVKKKPLGRIDNVHITVNNNLVPVDFVVLDIECNASCPIVLGRPFLRTVGAVIDMREGNIKYQFPLKKGMEHFPRKRMKLPFDSIIRTSYDVDASTLDVT
ncbi:hypothetical protein QYE76_068448 [Lolium multiflorum]|uniref:KIB1-4 beta-propeller domain-containing protein n=1 Tax=Lolium multiflorum TaxID=4521 RepID=A0AAD8WBY6_LOLMU|nr:hypothetical protein QYE76_068448 [Lolium multiflorum]